MKCALLPPGLWLRALQARARKRKARGRIQVRLYAGLLTGHAKHARGQAHVPREVRRLAAAANHRTVAEQAAKHAPLECLAAERLRAAQGCSRKCHTASATAACASAAPAPSSVLFCLPRAERIESTQHVQQRKIWSDRGVPARIKYKPVPRGARLPCGAALVVLPLFFASMYAAAAKSLLRKVLPRSIRVPFSLMRA